VCVVYVNAAGAGLPLDPPLYVLTSYLLTYLPDHHRPASIIRPARPAHMCDMILSGSALRISPSDIYQFSRPLILKRRLFVNKIVNKIDPGIVVGTMDPSCGWLHLQIPLGNGTHR